MRSPAATPIETARLSLEPLSPRHAQEALAAPELYASAGGEPPTKDVLQARYHRQAVGHASTEDTGWLNWIIRERAWLLDRQVLVVRALIHPDHHASGRVAHRLGLVPTSALVDGESVWELRRDAPADH